MYFGRLAQLQCEEVESHWGKLQFVTELRSALFIFRLSILFRVVPVFLQYIEKEKMHPQTNDVPIAEALKVV